MNFILEKLSGNGLSHRPVVEEDFFRICEIEGIFFSEIDEPFSWWMCLDGMSCITVDRRLKGYKRLFTLFHELAHHFLHGGTYLTTLQPFGAHNGKTEYEADAFAVIAVYPLSAMLNGQLLEAEKSDPYLRKLRKERERIYFLYGI
jgi:Zn-dependent peptidase ImmA (M78 family)